MNQLFDDIYSENNNVIQFRQKCSYKKSESNSRNSYIKTVTFNSDYSSGLNSDPTNTICDLITNLADAENSASLSCFKFIPKQNLKFCGPILSSKCQIRNIKETNFDRKFGFIQTLKSFCKSEYDYAFKCSDFQASLLRNQDEVIDTDSGNNTYKPFYSEKSVKYVPAGKSLSDRKVEIEITLEDDPFFKIKLKSKKNGRLKTYERHVEFFVYLIMRSQLENGEWRDDVLDKYVWFIYFNWSHINNNGHLQQDYGFLNCDRNPPDPRIFDEDCRYACNNDRVTYWINPRNGDIEIEEKDFPKSIQFDNEEEKQNFLGRIKEAVIMLN